MKSEDKALTNHAITVCLEGGATLGPFKATWSTEIVSDVRELIKEYDAFLQGEEQKRFKYHLHDPAKKLHGPNFFPGVNKGEPHRL